MIYISKWKGCRDELIQKDGHQNWNFISYNEESQQIVSNVKLIRQKSYKNISWS